MGAIIKVSYADGPSFAMQGNEKIFFTARFARGAEFAERKDLPA